MYEKVPQFNAPIFLENKEQIGKVDEIFGPIKRLRILEFYKSNFSLRVGSLSFFLRTHKILNE